MTQSQRDERQQQAVQWATKAFGVEHCSSRPMRGLRLVEEAIEAAQACGCDPKTIHKLVDFIYTRPPGNLAQELGGVGLTTLILSGAVGLSADKCEVVEFMRVLSKPAKEFTERNQQKIDAGFKP